MLAPIALTAPLRKAGAAPTPPQVRPPATFLDLIEEAIAVTRALADDGPSLTREAQGRAASAAAAFALVQLGQALLRPLGRPVSVATRPSTDARTLQQLQEAARPWDWDVPRPSRGASAALLRACALIHAAAELWETHRLPGGAQRSPDAARMRHPAMLGAAKARWRLLVQLWMGLCLEGPVMGTPIQTASKERFTSNRPMPGSSGLEHLTVARPTVIPGGEPVIEMIERLRHIRLTAWTLSRSARPPALIQIVVANLGLRLAESHTAIHDRSVRVGGHDRRQELLQASDCRGAELRWRALHSHVRQLRTAHAPSPGLASECLVAVETVRSVCRPDLEADLHEARCDALADAHRLLLEAARLNRASLTRSHGRREILIDSRALPPRLLSQHLDWVEARVRTRCVPLPWSIARTIDQAYADVLGTAPHSRPSGRPSSRRTVQVPESRSA